MQYFDNGHLPEPDEHFADGLLKSAKTIFRIGIEAVGLGLIAFGSLPLLEMLMD